MQEFWELGFMSRAGAQVKKCSHLWFDTLCNVSELAKDGVSYQLRRLEGV